MSARQDPLDPSQEIGTVVHAPSWRHTDLPLCGEKNFARVTIDPHGVTCERCRALGLSHGTAHVSAQA